MEQALSAAVEKELDLVEVAPRADPPVCRLLDYGKFKYRQKKKQRQKHHKAQLKEIRIGIKTAEHDLQFKADRIKGFLEEHDGVTVTLRLKGRERAHGQLAREKLAEFVKRFEDIAKIERNPTWHSSSCISIMLVHK